MWLMLIFLYPHTTGKTLSARMLRISMIDNDVIVLPECSRKKAKLARRQLCLYQLSQGRVALPSVEAPACTSLSDNSAPVSLR